MKQKTKKSTKTSPAVGLTILFVGPQGSGKGTQALLLAKHHRFLHIEMGAILRGLRHRRHPSPFAKRVASLIDQGKLVPSQWVVRLLDEQLKKIPQRRAVVLDGSARRLREARAIFQILHRHGRTLDLVIFLTIPRAETIRRLQKRWVCTRHRHILIMGQDIKRPSDLCPVCHGPVEKRDDDTPTGIKKRLALYQKETFPVLQFFADKGLMVRINGHRPIRAVFRDVERAFHRIAK